MEKIDRHDVRWPATLFGVMTVVVTLAACMTFGAGPSGAIPPGDTKPCSKRVARAGFVAFVKAFNRGNESKLDSLFAQSPDFQWYSSGRPGQRLGRKASRRDTLMGYFRRRHADHERFHLRRFDFNTNSPHWSNFGLYLSRRADGFQGGAWYRTIGKGSLVCEDGQPRFIVISLGGPVS